MSGGQPPLRLLGLHGYGQNRRSFHERTGALRKALRGRAELVCVSAPHRVPGPEAGDPRGWWLAEAEGAGPGLEESLAALAAAFAELGPFDGLLGFSQGAALAGLLCALRHGGDPRFPFRFAVLVAGFCSRAAALGRCEREPIALPSLHVLGRADRIVPAALSRELAARFVEPTLLVHPGGHLVPGSAPQRAALLGFLDAQFRLEMRCKVHTDSYSH
uniref:Esterase OVCA2 n=1 Tax=Pelusios castaneus TaxID=367368 RepID=A0A8C8S9T7_9SAUR